MFRIFLRDGNLQNLVVGFTSSFSLTNCVFSNITMLGDDPVFSFIKAEYDLQSLVDITTLQTSIIFSNCSFSGLVSQSFTSPAILYSNAVNQNFLFIDVIYTQILTSFIVFFIL